MSSIGVSVNLFSNQKLGHVLVNVRSRGWDWDDHVLLTLDGDPDILGIGVLSRGITRQGLGGSGKLIRLGSFPYVIYLTLQVLG